MPTPRFDHLLDLAVESEDALNFAQAEAHLNSAVTAAIKGTNSHQLLVAYYRFGAYLRRQGRHDDADAMEKMAEVCATTADAATPASNMVLENVLCTTFQQQRLENGHRKITQTV